MSRGSRESKHVSQQIYEREWLAREMNGFVAHETEAWKYLTGRFGERIAKEEILSLAQISSIFNTDLEFPLVREYKRRKETIIKWFDANFLKLRPFLETVEVIERSDPRFVAKVSAPK
jgi:hypothetical protein